MSIEGNIWNKRNKAWRELIDSGPISWNYGTNHQVSVNFALTGAIQVANGSAATTSTVDVTIIIGDGVAAITTSPAIKGYLPIDFAGTIVAWTLVADASGSIVIDIWKDTYANYPPTNADSITNGHEPTLSGVIKNQDTDLSDWTTVSIAAGDVLGFNVDSTGTVKQVTLTLKVTKTS